MEEVKHIRTTIIETYHGKCPECGEWSSFEITIYVDTPGARGWFTCENDDCEYTEFLCSTPDL